MVDIMLINGCPYKMAFTVCKEKKVLQVNRKPKTQRPGKRTVNAPMESQLRYECAQFRCDDVTDVIFALQGGSAAEFTKRYTTS